MAQLSRIHNLAQSAKVLPNAFDSHKPRSSSSISLRSQLWGPSKSWNIKHSNGCAAGNRKVGRFRVSASVAAATMPEIVLQPIKEISGTIALPGSKSLSNRILLLAALSEVTP